MERAFDLDDKPRPVKKKRTPPMTKLQAQVLIAGMLEIPINAVRLQIGRKSAGTIHTDRLRRAQDRCRGWVFVRLARFTYDPGVTRGNDYDYMHYPTFREMVEAVKQQKERGRYLLPPKKEGDGQ